MDDARWNWEPFLKALVYTAMCFGIAALPNFGWPIATYALGFSAGVGLVQVLKASFSFMIGDYIAVRWIAVGFAYLTPAAVILIWPMLDQFYYRVVVGLLFVAFELFVLVSIVRPDRQQ